MKTKDERCRLYPSITSTIALTLDIITYSLIYWPISQMLENLDFVVLLLAYAGLTDHVLRVLHLLSAFSSSFSCSLSDKHDLCSRALAVQPSHMFPNIEKYQCALVCKLCADYTSFGSE